MKKKVIMWILFIVIIGATWGTMIKDIQGQLAKIEARLTALEWTGPEPDGKDREGLAPLPHKSRVDKIPGAFQF